MTRIVLVRHGETVWHAENRYAGRTDVALNATGRQQAALLGPWAANAGLDAIYCSPLTRARVTAAAAAATTGLEPRVDARLRELDFGDAEGLTVAEMPPAVMEAFREDPVAHHLPGGEDPREAAARGVEALREITAERALVVAHTTLIRLALCALLGLPLADYRRRFPFVRNVALTEIELRDDATALLQFNAPLPQP